MAFRTYSAEFGQGGQSFNYVKDESLGASGTWRPSATSDLNPTLGTGSAYNTSYSNTFTSSFLSLSGAGKLLKVYGYNSGVAQFIKIIDGTTTGGNVIGVTAVGAQSNFNIDFSMPGVLINSGVVVALHLLPTGTPVVAGALISTFWKR